MNRRNRSMMMKIVSGTLASVLFLIAPTAEAQVTEIDIGGFVIAMSDSRTAQVFHIVDQLSEWSEFSRRGYGRWAARESFLTQEDRDLLQRHAELRSARGWNNGFEEAFYTDSPIEAAAEAAIMSGLLSIDEAMAEMAIMLHFEQRLDGLLDRSAAQVTSFRNRIIEETERISPIVRELVRFSEASETIRVPVYLVANPEEGSGGGGFNAGVLVVEVQRQPDPLSILIHEAFHALLSPHNIAIQAAAESAELTVKALNEGIAYAIAPGLTDTESDSLAEGLVRFLFAGRPQSDSYVQAYAVATVIRPLLQQALETDETVTAFLPKAAEKWRSFRGP